MSQAVLGFYDYVDTMMKGAEKLKESHYDDIEIFSPIPIEHEVDHLLGAKKNPLKYVTFSGALTGFIAGTVLALGTASMYILPQYGRPIWPFTPTLIISYEVTILFGVISTLLGFLFFAGLPSFKNKTYDVRFSDDKFGVLVKAPQDKLGAIEEILKKSGAGEVRRIDEN